MIYGSNSSRFKSWAKFKSRAMDYNNFPNLSFIRYKTLTT